MEKTGELTLQGPGSRYGAHVGTGVAVFSASAYEPIQARKVA